jgi:hypothetical protein
LVNILAALAYDVIVEANYTSISPNYQSVKDTLEWAGFEISEYVNILHQAVTLLYIDKKTWDRIKAENMNKDDEDEINDLIGHLVLLKII